MFYSLSTIACPPETLDEYLKFRESMIEPVLRKAPGFRSRLLLKNRQTEELLMIIGWDSDEAAQAYRASVGHDDLRDKTQMLLSGAHPQTEDFDILLG